MNIVVVFLQDIPASFVCAFLYKEKKHHCLLFVFNIDHHFYAFFCCNIASVTVLDQEFFDRQDLDPKIPAERTRGIY